MGVSLVDENGELVRLVSGIGEQRPRLFVEPERFFVVTEVVCDRAEVDERGGLDRGPHLDTRLLEPGARLGQIPQAIQRTAQREGGLTTQSCVRLPL